MVAIVELAIGSDDLADPSCFAALVSREAHPGNVYRSYPALLGYLIDCPLEPDMSPESLCHVALKTVRRGLRTMVRILKQHAPKALVAIEHRQATFASVLAAEDFLYCSTAPLQERELRPWIESLHRLAGARPG